ncbi:aldo/keto reductase [Metallosphaera hakonensis]|uniref:Aldo/keto reductase n=1 Tax=Metallosphaera hakonensis JCM 8857 = DSM 7519 TaxID=1293036 RepID=A0A2U9ISQ8_9CREN|nr:aldo/keto reductase [Metallosphaera hakonensis]AWR99044.1 aldo/keto reductase [Metallosphaera hakonensis JCM 8857 = DSM 7519]
MEFRDFGKTGVKVSAIGMGTYYDPQWIVLSRIGIAPSKERRINALKIGLEGGINFIDTAELYNTEELVAEAIKNYDREKIFIATKVWPSHLKYDSLIKAAKNSLKRLKTKYIDLYQIHFPSRTVPIGESMSAMEKLVDDGLIRFIGVSNFNLEQLKKAQDSLKKYQVSSIQMPYSLVDRRIESDIIPYAKENGISVICYYPLGHGRLAKRFPSDAVEMIKRNHGEKTFAQIALNWIISKHENTFPIPRASNPVHVKENLDAVGWRLSKDEVEKLEKYF